MLQAKKKDHINSSIINKDISIFVRKIQQFKNIPSNAIIYLATLGKRQLFGFMSIDLG